MTIHKALHFKVNVDRFYMKKKEGSEDTHNHQKLLPNGQNEIDYIKQHYNENII